MNRSRFLVASSSAAALAACSPSGGVLAPPALQSRLSGGARPSTSTFTRLEIAEFSKQHKLVASLRKGIKALRAITDPRNTGSYSYWHYSHWMPESNPPDDMKAVWDQCRHKQSYFEPWHRGFLYYFEKVLREASGDPDFALPYWDYYKNPNLPEIFADPTLGNGEANPLYWADRKRSVVEGLMFKAFQDDVTVFPWGPGTTYEDLIERNPHGRVHEQVGGSMARVPTAPADPIFFVHHCNIDRLWSAWVAAGGGRSMPPRDSRWWKETFAYNLDRSWSVSVEQIEDTSNLGYAYGDLSLPTPPRGASLPLRPPVVATGAANAAGPIALDSNSITVEIPLDGRAAASRFIDVVLDGVTLTELGRQGGYSYNVYANLPAARTPIAQEASFEIGELGSFELSMPRMNGMAMSPGAARTLRFAAAAPGASLLLSFVAYGSPAGVSRGAELIRIGRISVVPR